VVSTRRAKKAPREPTDERVRLALAGGIAGLLVTVLLYVAGVTDARALLATPLLALAGPVYLTLARLERYAPEVRDRPRIVVQNALLAVPLGLLVLPCWSFFPQVYAYIGDYPTSGGGDGYTAYLSEFQAALSTLGTQLVVLFASALVLSVQLALWILPAYGIARWTAAPLERGLDRQRPPTLHLRLAATDTSRVTRFQVGSERLTAKLRLRTQGTLTVLFTSLLAMNALAWVRPMLRG
jgi:hypothetical protein